MPGIAQIFLGPLQSLLNSLQTERHYRDKNSDEALLAIRSALLQTKKHIELNGPVRDRSKEYELAELWNHASIKARRANIPFASALTEKSRYWEDRELWEEDQVVAKGIKFSQIEEQLENLLSDS